MAWGEGIFQYHHQITAIKEATLVFPIPFFLSSSRCRQQMTVSSIGNPHTDSAWAKAHGRTRGFLVHVLTDLRYTAGVSTDPESNSTVRVT